MASIPNQLAIDARSLDSLKQTAKQSPDKALKAAATQFEAVFMNMILKSMRESMPKDGIFSSRENETYTEMLDQQLAQNLAGRSTGLADVLVKQLSKYVNTDKPAGLQDKVVDGGAMNAAGKKPSHERTGGYAAARATAAYDAVARAGKGEVPGNGSSNKGEFVSRVEEHARAAEAATGIPARFMVGQAALETGWGQREIRHPNGENAFNPFGIKATGSWTGPVAEVTTTEYINGVAKKVVEKFRAYASYAESFADYAKLMASNPRYANVLKTAQQGVEQFAQSLQRAGYATDPSYADKLAKTISEAINVRKSV